MDGRPISTAIGDTRETQLGRAISPLLEAHPNLSGIFPLRDARDAFAARMRLAQQAERTLDLQYYIWREDMTGTLLFQALHDAADRGVRVRLLLDDNNTSGLDPMLAALDSHPNIEVRLFNPFVIRKPRIGYLTDFFRANRRMHNKSFTVDNQATIIGASVFEVCAAAVATTLNPIASNAPRMKNLPHRISGGTSVCWSLVILLVRIFISSRVASQLIGNIISSGYASVLQRTAPLSIDQGSFPMAARDVRLLRMQC